MNDNPLKIAFDIDDTLWKVRGEPYHDQVPNYELINVLKFFSNNGDRIYVWSGGGVEYARQIVTKLGLDDYVTEVIPKVKLGTQHLDMDIAFDDSEVGLAKVNVKLPSIEEVTKQS